ncbi:MAG: hypothetical protein HKN22_04260, partial [Bacteroidia bacterium]|nr:hypothetical protein [Bacteroidia bacterium]
TVGWRPTSMVADVNNKLWVLCSGSLGPDWTPGTADDIAGSLHRIDPMSGMIEQSFAMNSADHPRNLKINAAGDVLYFLHGNSDYTGELRSMAVTASVLPSSSILNRQCYGLGVDAKTGIIYCGIAPSFSVNGTVLRINGSTGIVIDSLVAGIGPNGFAFEQ